MPDSTHSSLQALVCSDIETRSLSFLLALTSHSNSNHQNSTSLLVNSIAIPNTKPFGKLSIIHRLNSAFQIKNNHPVERVFLPAIDCIDLVGSVKGLVCLCHIFKPRMFVIWNPLTNSSKTIWKPYRSSSERYCKSISGFCYDQHQVNNNDFKILDIEKFEMRAELGRKLQRVEVYSCNTNTWNEIRDHTLPVSSFDLMCNLESKIYVKFHSNPGVLVAFDAHDEVFRSFPCPRNSIDGEIVKYCVNWMDSLGVIVRNGRTDLDVYMLDEGKGTWVKWYTLDDRVKQFMSQFFRSFNDGDIVVGNDIFCSFNDGDIAVGNDMEDMLHVFEPGSTFMLKDLIRISPLSWVKVMSYKPSIFWVEGMQYLGNVKSDFRILNIERCECSQSYGGHCSEFNVNIDTPNFEDYLICLLLGS